MPLLKMNWFRFFYPNVLIDLGFIVLKIMNTSAGEAGSHVLS